MHGDQDGEDDEERGPTAETSEMARILELSPSTLRKMRNSGALTAEPKPEKADIDVDEGDVDEGEADEGGADEGGADEEE